jgi:hypothetical protein
MLDRFQEGGKYDIFATRPRAAALGAAVGSVLGLGAGEAIDLLNNNVIHYAHGDVPPLGTAGAGALVVAVLYGVIAGHRTELPPGAMRNS